MIIQSGLWGVILTLTAYPYFLSLVEFLRVRLGNDYGEDRVTFTIISNGIHLLSYVVINGSFGLFDYLNLFQEYKLSRKPFMIPSGKLISSTIFHAALSQLLINPVATYYAYPMFRRLGLGNMTDPLPSIWTIFGIYVFCDFFNGAGFYIAHRSLHSKWIYAYIHKQHHEYSGTIGITAEYANPIEQILANLIPTLGGVILYGTHPIVFCVWLVSYYMISTN